MCINRNKSIVFYFLATRIKLSYALQKKEEEEDLKNLLENSKFRFENMFVDDNGTKFLNNCKK